MFAKLAIATLAILLIAAFLAWRKRYRGLALAVGCCVLTLVIGVWAIFQSRSSTAGIGLLFLPFYGVFSGGMAWLYRNLTHSENRLLRAMGWLSLVLSLAVPGWLLYSGLDTIALNRSRDAQHQASVAEIESNRQQIKVSLASHPGRETEIVEGLLREHASNRNFVLPLLETRHVTPATLAHLAASDDLGVALSAVRNPACPAEALVRVYQTHAYPDYFFQAIAAHANAPPAILLDLYRRPATIMGLDRSFAINPATPREILVEIAGRTHESFVVQQLLQNPKLDCALLPAIETALRRSERPADNYSQQRLGELRSGVCSTSR